MTELTAAVRLTSAGGSADHLTGGHGQPVSVRVVAGGEERSDSVAAGLRALPPAVGIVLVHDAARALTPASVFERVVAAVRHGHPAVTPALRVTDTIKTVDIREHVVSTPDRASLRAVQTPQGFLRETLERAHRDGGGAVTDDAGLVEAMGGSVLVVEGDARSLKITGPEDLAIVSSWLRPPSGTAAAPVLLVLGGLPGTGKTTLARAWAARRRAAHVRVDTIEQALLQSAATHGTAPGPEGYAAAYAVAADQLQVGIDVVADSVNPLAVTRHAWQEVARRAGARLLQVELGCDEQEHQRRVASREADIDGHRLPEWSEVREHDYEDWPGADLSLDTTDRPVAELVDRIDDHLARPDVSPAET